ncbi:MAG: ribonuclease, partial [Solirubrobacteraceae bacterium]|nr:ribonuclease [Solirubrobacteraceae bacterium]
ERELYGGDPGRAFEGEVSGLISAGAFIAFGRAGAASAENLALPFEGMLPVRMMRSPAATQRAAREPGRRPAGGHGARTGRSDGAREWWEINEQGTMLIGERSGAALRLGQHLAVRVARVDRIRGRVDLLPAG